MRSSALGNRRVGCPVEILQMIILAILYIFIFYILYIHTLYFIFYSLVSRILIDHLPPSTSHFYLHYHFLSFIVLLHTRERAVFNIHVYPFFFIPATNNDLRSSGRHADERLPICFREGFKILVIIWIITLHRWPADCLFPAHVQQHKETQRFPLGLLHPHLILVTSEV